MTICKVSWLLTAILLTAAPLTHAQQATKIPRIGYLAGASASSQVSRIAALQQRLRELGYVEGKNLLIEFRYAEGKAERSRELARELVRLNLDLIVTGGPTATDAARQASATIPIVMAQDNDPVANGFIASLARPGGNITGLSTLAPEISGKRLELLKEIVPRLERVAVIGQSSNPGNALALKETELAARAFGLRLQYLDVNSPEDIGATFQAASKGRADAIVALGSPLLVSRRKEVVELAVKTRLPATYNVAEFVIDGGLMTYGVSYTDLYRRVATYVDKILKGTKPADLPVEQPIKFEFIVNLKAAKAIGLAIPPNVLVRADRVIR